MLLKYTSKKKLSCFFILCILRSCHSISMAYITSEFITIATHPVEVSKLYLFLVVVSLLILFFGCLGFAFSHMYNSLVYDIDMYVRNLAIQRLCEDGNDIDLSFMTNDLKQIEQNVIYGQLNLLFDITSFVLTVVTCISQSIIFTLISLVTMLIPILFQHILSGRVEEKSRIWEGENSKYTIFVTDLINGMDTFHLYGTIPVIINKFTQKTTQLEQRSKELNNTIDNISNLVSLLSYFIGALVPLVTGLYLVYCDMINLKTFILISQLSMTFINPISGILECITDMHVSKPILNKIFKPSRKSMESNSTISNEHFKQIKLRDIDFCYGTNIIQKHIDLKIKLGEKILISAPSGWGKTTLLNFLLGNLESENGEYLLNQVNLKGNRELAKHYFSYIHQKPLILEDTIEYNITLGRKTNTKELQEILQIAGLTDLVNQKGLSFKLKSDGKNLLGGQAQRIEIARALLSHRPILLADEPTSALDLELSIKIHRLFLEAKGLTVIEVSHHLRKEEYELFDRVIKLA